MVKADRRVHLWSHVVECAQGGPVTVRDVCTAVISAAGVDSAAIAVALTAAPREAVYSSDRVASELEELSLTLGEGPCVDALAGGLTMVPDVGAPGCLARWPLFARAAMDAGIRAVFALPLQVGAIRLGAMDLYRAVPGGLDQARLADALMLADAACTLLIDAAGDRPRAAGRGPEPTGLQHPEIHQATGMISVQLGLSVASALARLRAHAYANDLRLRDVAADVVARRLRFDAGNSG